MIWSEVLVKRSKNTKERKAKVTPKWSIVKAVPCPLRTRHPSFAITTYDLECCPHAPWPCSCQYIQGTVMTGFTLRKLPQSYTKCSIMLDIKNHWHGPFGISWSKVEFHTLILAKGIKVDRGCNNRYLCNLKAKECSKTRAQSNIYSQ